MMLPLFHPVLVLVALMVAWPLGDARLVAVAGALSLAGFAFERARPSSPNGRFGQGNAVTSLRLGLVVVLSLLPSLGPLASLLVLAILLLDGLDGVLARRFGTASPFGATFDMETDALLVLVVGFRLAASGRLPPFILLPGLYRYVYAIAVAVLPHARGEAPRSRFGRSIFGVVVASAAVSLWPISWLSLPLALLATALVTLSFARSAVWSFVPRGGARLALLDTSASPDEARRRRAPAPTSSP